MKRSLLIIPAFNEENALPGLIREVRAEFPELDMLVVDDGSTDGTRRSALEAGAAVVSHIDNMGYGVSLQTGYKYAWKSPEYQQIVQMDGDGQHNPKDIGRLLDVLAGSETDLVIGSRFLAGEESYQVPVLRRLGVSFFRGLLTLFTGQRIKDITSGFQAFNRKVLAAYVSDEFPYYFPDADVLLLQLRTGLSIKEVPSVMTGNPEGRSMHTGLGRQIFYVISMILSIGIAVVKTWAQNRILRSSRDGINSLDRP